MKYKEESAIPDKSGQSAIRNAARQLLNNKRGNAVIKQLCPFIICILC